MSRKLLEDVSLSELQQLRAEGHSNQEIADLLDVSYATVYKYLGKQPSTVRKPREFVAAPVAPVAPKKQDEPADAKLVVRNRCYTLEGTVGRYQIDGGNVVTVTLKDTEGCVLVGKDQLADFIAELQAIQRNVEKTAVGLEAW